MRKKIGIFLIALLTVLICAVLLAACNNNELNGPDFLYIDEQGLSYRLEKKAGSGEYEWTVSYYPGAASGELYISDEHKDDRLNFKILPEISVKGHTFPVTKIGTFRAAVDMAGIEIPDGITYIGSFYGCYNLTEITIPKSVTKISPDAFNTCYRLKSIVIPDGVTEIGFQTFYNCYELESVTLGKNTASIDTYAFAKCKKLKNINIPDTVARIGDFAFAGCEKLETLVLPKGLTKISEYTFEQCSSLANITLHEGITDIGAMAFRYCSALKTINLPKSLKSIGSNAFIGSNARLNIPANVEIIEKWATQATVYCEAGTQPEGWHGEWDLIYPVAVWGCVLSADKSYVVSFTKNETSTENPDKLDIDDPNRGGYAFGGWALSADDAEHKIKAYDTQSLSEAANGTNLYAIWTKI